MLGEDRRPKTGRSKRDVVTIDEANFQRREWLPALRALRVRPFYNCRHTYISTLLAAGAKPLFAGRRGRGRR